MLTTMHPPVEVEEDMGLGQLEELEMFLELMEVQTNPEMEVLVQTSVP